MTKTWFWLLAAVSVLGLAIAVVVVLATPGDLNVLDGEVADEIAYLFVFVCIVGDAIIPMIMPGETVVNASAVLAAEGQLEIGWVIVASCAGAIVGDNLLYWIARLTSDRFQPQVERLERGSWVQTVLRIVGERAPLFIVLGRYVPGVRFFVNASMGIQEVSVPEVLALVIDRRDDLGDVHRAAGLLGRERAFRLSGRVVLHLRLDHDHDHSGGLLVRAAAIAGERCAVAVGGRCGGVRSARPSHASVGLSHETWTQSGVLQHAPTDASIRCGRLVGCGLRW